VAEIKRNITSAGYMVHLPKKKFRTGFSRDLGVDGKIILKRILKRWIFECLVKSSGSGLAPVAVSCEHGNKLLYSIKGDEFHNS
jgi:hypothetical protein